MAINIVQTPEIVAEAAKALVRMRQDPPRVDLIDKSRVCVVVIHQGMIHYRTALWLDHQRQQGVRIICHTEQALLSHESSMVEKYLNCSVARDTARRKALETEADYFMFLDADVVPPINAVDHFLLQRTPVRGGWYPIKMPSDHAPRYVAGRWVADNRFYNYERPDTTQLLESHILPAGCCMLDRCVAELIPFEAGTHLKYIDHATGLEGVLGECGFYGNQLHKLGETTWMNPAIICDHESLS